ncbi:HAL3 [Symbiodinium sp. KB8]|nr:HAL3 [Symbiodinium sp. KB8]
MVFAWETQEAKVPSAPPADSKAIHVYRDSNEWQYYGQVGKDPVLHIELRKWADLLLIAPCSANTLAKLAGGLADNLLTCIARAWEVGQKPMLIAPAMNTAMWEHPLTSRHLAVVTDILCGVVVPPQPAKRLACGDSGAGALATIPAILDAVQASAQHGDGQELAPATPGGSAAPSVPVAASSTGGP